MKFKISPGILGRYKNLNYQPWYAISEFVDNSLHSFLLNRDDLLRNGREEDKLFVTISYDSNDQILRVVDDSSGMTLEDLESSLEIGRSKEKTVNQLSEFGMGMKTSAIWLGNLLTIRTKHYSSPIEYYVEIDIEKIMQENFDIVVQSQKSTSQKVGYTIIEVRNHNRKFQGRTIGVIKDTLKSIYSKFITEGILELRFGDQVLTPDVFTPLVSSNGNVKKLNFDFNVNEKRVTGFVGILNERSGKHSGFSIYRHKRLIRGYPENNFRPREIFAEEGGTNTLVNQRVYGELIMDDFNVTHTKDDISFNHDEEAIFRKELERTCREMVNIAKGGIDTLINGAIDVNDPKIHIIGQDIRESLNSQDYKDMYETMSLDVQNGTAVLEDYVKTTIEIEDYLFLETEIVVNNGTETIGLRIFLNCEEHFAPYLVIDKDFVKNSITVIVNTQHAYVKKVVDKNETFKEFIMQCAFDALAENFVMNRPDHLIRPDEFRLAKDRFLKIYSIKE